MAGTAKLAYTLHETLKREPDAEGYPAGRGVAGRDTI